MHFVPCHSSLDPLWNSRFSAVFVIPACAPFASRSYIQHPPGWLTPLWLGVRVMPKSSCFQVRPTHNDTFWVSLFCTSCIYSRRQGFLAREKQAGLLDALAPSPPPPHHSCAWQFHAAKSEPANHKHWQILYIAGYRHIGYSCLQRSSTKELLLHKARKWQPNLMLKALSSNPFQWWWMKQKPFNAQSPIALAIHKSSELLALWSQIFVTFPTLLTQPIHIRYNAPASSSLPSICYLVLPGQRNHKVVFIICSKQVSKRFCPNLQKACHEFWKLLILKMVWKNPEP